MPHEKAKMGEHVVAVVTHNDDTRRVIERIPEKNINSTNKEQGR